MMNYLQRPKRRLFISGLFILIVVLGLVTLAILPMPSFLTSVAHFVGIPLWRGEANLLSGVQAIFLMVKDKTILEGRVRALQDEISVLKLQLTGYTYLENENKQLKDFLGRSKEGVSYVLAGVLRRPSSNLYDTMIVDAGSKEGVEKGDIALALESVAIGTVEDVFSGTATVVPYSAPLRETPVLLGISHIPITAKGRGSGNFLIELPKGVTVGKGDAVVLPGISGHIIGLVEEIIEKPTDSFQTILFKSPTNIAELRFVVFSKESQE